MQFDYSTSKVKVTIHVSDAWEILDWSVTLAYKTACR
jgi:hypothetical protein